MTIHDLFAANVSITRDLAYVDDDPGPRHTLDVYADPDRTGLPVVVFLYGGGWRSGDKRLFEHLGRAMVVRGVMAVTVNYRLTPAVRHPAHAIDCATALSWVYNHISEYGGDPSSLFLMGHSAGAHLASLITLDRRYLERVALSERVVRGVIVVSGACDLTIHSETTVFTTKEQIEEAFGATTEELAAASPMTYVRTGIPPFLVIVAEKDSEGLRLQGRRFADALREAGGEVVYLSIKGRDHYSIVRRFGPADDTTAGAVADFIKHVTRSTSPGAV